MYPWQDQSWGVHTQKCIPPWLTASPNLLGLSKQLKLHRLVVKWQVKSERWHVTDDPWLMTIFLLNFLGLSGIVATVRIRRDIQCLPYAGFSQDWFALSVKRRQFLNIACNYFWRSSSVTHWICCPKTLLAKKNMGQKIGLKFIY